MSNLSITERLVATAHEQHLSLKNALEHCFDTCLDGLQKTLSSVEELHEKDSYFFMRASRTYDLKNEITTIQKEYDLRSKQALQIFNEQKNYCKEILLLMINELETIVNASEIRRYIHHLSIMISQIIQDDPIFKLCRSGNIFQWILQILLVSNPDFVNNLTGKQTFQDKLNELMTKIKRECSQVLERKQTNVSKIAQYFNSFIAKVNTISSRNVPSTIKIIWYDALLGNDENQSYIKRIQEKFPTNELIQCLNKNRLIQLIQNESVDEIILLTSGKSGQSILNQIGYYWNLKGIIIFCNNVDYHQTWTKSYKKVISVTNRFDDLIIQIQNILHGKSYFITKGFTYDDICLNLRKIRYPNYYLSFKANDAFIISDFNQINLNVTLQKEVMQQLYNQIQTKDLFNGQLPPHFQLSNLESIAEHFVKAFDKKLSKSIASEIIHLYSQSKPCLYKVVNDILNSLDEQLILLIGDYIKTIRYSLIKYVDNEPKMKNTEIIRLYRGIHLDHQSTENFLKKFKINDYIIFPSFLSTTMDKAIALQFSQQKGVLLEILVDSTININDNRPKCIKTVSAFQNEEEILFNCFSMLEINSITPQNQTFYLYQCTLKVLD